MSGYLDRLRENLVLVDEGIERARGMGGVDGREALQWAKLLRDLVEQRTLVLTEVKAHLLGRDESGAVRPPPNCYDGNPEVMFERDFRNFL